MHCGVMVTGYNHGDWERLMAGDYSRPPAISDHVQFANTIHMGDLVEPLGFDSIWATEHYGSAYSMQPNPLQYLAFWAGRTQRVDVGTAVIVAPWWNPVRLASELSMLDVLLQGRRMHLGIGRGVSQHEYSSLGVPIEESHDYYYDVVDAFRTADGTQRFTFEGKVFKIPPTSIRPMGPHWGDLSHDIKVAFTTKKSAQLAAEHGLGQMFVANDDVESMVAGVNQFNEIRSGLGLRPAQPTTLLWMYCAETEAEAEEGWRFFEAQQQAAQYHYFQWNSPDFSGVKGYEEYAKRQASDAGAGGAQTMRNTQPIGTPEQIIERLTTLQRRINLEELVIHVFYGGMSVEKAERSMRLFAEKVLPAVHAIDVTIPENVAR
jgi:alkanesulfonate monooxygenase SsuD/methylene tetrahydromethanopterin reductase-like flavin-dependent oxidoreductase (luciferase family)